ncbi:MAG: hypothetical protein WC285_03380 [Candidatus Gracilibacteria bacterium]|jgi:hypothetical protein
MPTNPEQGATVEIDINNVPDALRAAVRGCILRAVAVTDTPELYFGGPVEILQERFSAVVATVGEQFPAMEVVMVDGNKAVVRARPPSAAETAQEEAEELRGLYIKDWEGIKNHVEQARRVANWANEGRGRHRITVINEGLGYMFEYRGRKIGIVDTSTRDVRIKTALLAWTRKIDVEEIGLD